MRCRDEVYSPRPGEGSLEQLLREAKDRFAPFSTTRTLRNWWNFFLLNGDCKPVIARKMKYLRRYLQKLCRGKWNDPRTDILKDIVDKNPELYLDEIQEAFTARTGELWSPSMLWKKLVSEAGYSLQVATDRATKQQQEDIS